MIAHRPITGRMVLYAVLGFFGVIIAANLALVYFALHSWPGLGVEQAYQKGLAYNDTLAAAEAQAKTGWRSQIEVTIDRVEVNMVDVAGAPLGGLTVSVELRRAVAEGGDMTVRLTESRPGVYAAPAALPMPGRWNATVRAAAPDGSVPPYRLEHELIVK